MIVWYFFDEKNEVGRGWSAFGQINRWNNITKTQSKTRYSMYIKMKEKREINRTKKIQRKVLKSLVFAFQLISKYVWDWPALSSKTCINLHQAVSVFFSFQFPDVICGEIFHLSFPHQKPRVTSFHVMFSSIEVYVFI